MARAKSRTASRLQRSAGPAAAGRPTPPDGDDRAGGPRPPSGRPSLAMQLAAEVDTLKAELADARVRVALLEISAERDPLLDILNRRGFERELMRSLSYVRRYGTMAALIYIDLDGFKPVNDRFGHAAGDAMLQAVAATLSRNVRASDVVARLGGDELAVLLWNCSGEDAIAKAETLEALIAATTITWAGEPMSVGASAGAAALESEDGPADVLARADRSMYARKALHRKAGRRGPREK